MNDTRRLLSDIFSSKRPTDHEEPTISERRVILFYKALCVFICSSMGAAIVPYSYALRTYRNMPPVLTTELQVPTGILLAVVWVLSLLLKSRGKVSASWAFLAFGSFSVATLNTLAAFLWFSADEWGTRWGTFLWWIMLAGILIAGGMSQAIIGRWWRMLWWLTALFLFWVDFCVMLNYAPFWHYLRHRPGSMRSIK